MAPGRLPGMLEGRRNGWYVLGGGMIAAGVAWLATPPRSLPDWLPPSYVAVGLIVAGLLVVVAVMYDWPARLRRKLRAVRSSSYDGLRLELVNAKWEFWQRTAWLVDIQVRVTNTTPDRVIELSCFELDSDPGPYWVERPVLTQDQVNVLFHQMQRRRDSYGPEHLHQMTLQSGDSRLGWLASHAYLPYPALKGKPYCVLTVTDAEGETCTLPIPGQGAHAREPPHDLLQLRSRAIEGRRLRERLPADGTELANGELARFQGWAVKVADALESQPGNLAQFQRSRTPAAQPSVTEIDHCTKTLEEIVRTLEGRPSRSRPLPLITAALTTALAAVVIVTTVLRNPGTPAHPRPVAHLSPAATLPDPGNETAVYSIAFGRGGTTLAAGDQIGITYLWNLATLQPRPLPEPSKDGVNAVAFNPDGTILATADSRRHIYLWNVTTRKIIHALSGIAKLGQGVQALAFSQDGRTLAGAEDNGNNGTTYLWNLGTPKPAKPKRFTDINSGGMDSVAFNFRGTILATGDDSGTTYLRDTATGTIIGTFTDTDNPSPGVDSVAFSTDGTILAAGNDNGHVDLWTMVTHSHTTLDNPKERGEGVNSVAFNRNGTILAAGDNNGSIYLWNVSTGRLITTLIDPGSAGVAAVAFSPAGATLASGDKNGSTYLWNLTGR